MAFIPVPDGAEVVVHQTLFGQEIVNTLWVTQTGVGAFTYDELHDIALSVYNTWTDNILPHQSHDLAFVYVSVTDMQAPGGLQAIVAPAGPVNGGVVSNSLPGNVAFVITFKTGHTGRSYRGRMYLAGIPLSLTSGNTITSAEATAFTSGMQAVFTGLDDLGAVPVVVSKYADKAPRTTAMTTPINSITTIDLNLDSQRRRLNGRGA